MSALSFLTALLFPPEDAEITGTILLCNRLLHLLYKGVIGKMVRLQIWIQCLVTDPSEREKVCNDMGLLVKKRS
ncbi:MAG: hypothetical protein CR981_03900 [Proteobacteria bacterium]|nr:MAG: hypothetical protein CR981_03900 [Pseudomonadota bacterium]